MRDRLERNQIRRTNAGTSSGRYRPRNQYPVIGTSALKGTIPQTKITPLFGPLFKVRDILILVRDGIVMAITVLRVALNPFNNTFSYGVQFGDGTTRTIEQGVLVYLLHRYRRVEPKFWLPAGNVGAMSGSSEGHALIAISPKLV